MKSDKNQTLTLIGISLVIIAGILIFVALSQPRVYEETKTVTSSRVNETSAQTTLRETEKSVNTEAPESPTTTAPKFPMDINKASADELALVPGLGESKARAIVEYRGVIGKYTDVSQITDIQGFGESTYAKVSPYLKV